MNEFRKRTLHWMRGLRVICAVVGRLAEPCFAGLIDHRCAEDCKKHYRRYPSEQKRRL